MTTIWIDPDELSAISKVFRDAAVQLSDIGSQLKGCVSCPMPPEVEHLVTQIVSVDDQILDHVAMSINSEAEDLLNRAGLARSDSLSAGSAGSALIGGGFGAVAVGAASSGVGPSLVGGGDGFGVVAASSGVGSPLVGGGGGFGSGIASSWQPGPMIISAPTRPEGNMFTNLMKVETNQSDRVAALEARIMANPNLTPRDIQAVTNSRILTSQRAGSWALPGKSQIESNLGRLITTGEYYDRVPQARPVRVVL